jgi:pyrimidine operon attenuation protein / uracil phosphoribosyltransferase
VAYPQAARVPGASSAPHRAGGAPESPPPSPPAAPSKAILTDDDLHRVVDRIAHQVLEKTHGASNTVFLGIPTRGVPLARRLAARIRAFEGIDMPVGVLDVTLYRDDLRR